jgi:hypothetical protein
MIKAHNMISARGSVVINQIIIETPTGKILSSYGHNVAKVDIDGTITLGTKWDYSATTSKYRNLFLQMSSAETKKAVERGDIQICKDL